MKRAIFAVTISWLILQTAAVLLMQALHSDFGTDSLFDIDEIDIDESELRRSFARAQEDWA